DDEFAARRGKVAIGNINSDALLPLGPKAVGEIGKIYLASTGDVGGPFERLQLVLHKTLRIIKQSADQRGLAVINASTGVEAQDFDRVGGVGHGRVKRET